MPFPFLAHMACLPFFLPWAGAASGSCILFTKHSMSLVVKAPILPLHQVCLALVLSTGPSSWRPCCSSSGLTWTPPKLLGSGSELLPSVLLDLGLEKATAPVPFLNHQGPCPPPHPFILNSQTGLGPFQGQSPENILLLSHLTQGVTS